MQRNAALEAAHTAEAARLAEANARSIERQGGDGARFRRRAAALREKATLGAVRIRRPAPVMQTVRRDRRPSARPAARRPSRRRSSRSAARAGPDDDPHEPGDIGEGAVA